MVYKVPFLVFKVRKTVYKVPFLVYKVSFLVQKEISAKHANYAKGKRKQSVRTLLVPKFKVNIRFSKTEAGA